MLFYVNKAMFFLKCILRVQYFVNSPYGGKLCLREVWCCEGISDLGTFKDTH